MFIDISEILTTKGASLAFNVSEEISEAGFSPDVEKFLSPVKVEGTVTNVNGDFCVYAKGCAEVQMSCSRCLKPVNRNVKFNVDEIFSSTGKDEETEAFTGNIIELSSVVKKCILFSLPMKVVCREDCKGLCPVCGKDLNEGSCNCSTEYINPKFEGLRSLFKIDEEV